MEQSREEFLHRRNVENYRKLLAQAPEEARRRMLEALLAEEAAKAKANGWRSFEA